MTHRSHKPRALPGSLFQLHPTESGYNYYLFYKTAKYQSANLNILEIKIKISIGEDCDTVTIGTKLI